MTVTSKSVFDGHRSFARINPCEQSAGNHLPALTIKNGIDPVQILESGLLEAAMNGAPVDRALADTVGMSSEAARNQLAAIAPLGFDHWLTTELIVELDDARAEALRFARRAKYEM